MKLPVLLSFALLLAIVVLPAAAQQPTTVQLPTFSFFSVQTSVLAPDQGNAPLGRFGHAVSGRAVFGPWAPQPAAISSNRRMGLAPVAVTIHDFRAMEAVLADAAGKQPTAGPTGTAADSNPARHAADDPGNRSVADIRRSKEAVADAARAEVLALLDKAAAADEQGKPGVATLYYEMAYRRADGELKKRLVEILQQRGPTRKKPSP
jgi:hypothetical protein